MNDKERQMITDTKDKWLEMGNFGRAAACDFLLMKDRGIDIVYDAEDETAKEYVCLLKKKLQTDNDRLVLMVSTEIEKCLMDEKEEVFAYLSDEIYGHFQKSGGEYPLQAVGFHIDAINSLAYLGYVEKYYYYMRVIRDTHREIFGEESFLFCRNWCYVMNETMRIFSPRDAVIEFDVDVDLFSKVLKEEDILYQFCINIGIEKTKQEQDAGYLKQAVDLCEAWCRDIPAEMQKGKQDLIRIMRAMYYRNTGELDTALKAYREEADLTERRQYKLYLLNQIVNILFVKNDMDKVPGILEEGNKIIASLPEQDENVAEFYNISALYFRQKRQYDKASPQFDKAIAIAEQVMGRDADTVVKYRYNKLVMEYDMGYIDEAYEKIMRLYQIVCDNMACYPDSLPLILNGIMMLKSGSNFSSNDVKRMKDMLKKNQMKYDFASVLLFKCNLYYLMMAGDDVCDREEWEPLQKELALIFERYPYADGYLLFLMGEYCRIFKTGDASVAHSEAAGLLDKIVSSFDSAAGAASSLVNTHCFYIALVCLLYKNEYADAASRLLSLRKNVIMPLLEAVCHVPEDGAEGIFSFLDTYVFLFVSAVRQYPQLKITEKDLYGFVLNLKYYEDLFYCRKEEFHTAVGQRRWLSEADIDMGKEDLVIECYDYMEMNMTDMGKIFSVSAIEEKVEWRRIYFGIQISPGILQRCTVSVIEDVPYQKLRESACSFYDTLGMDEVSEMEKKIGEKLYPFLDRKKRIIFCSDGDILLPLAFIRMEQEQYLGDSFQILYCNTAKDIKNDIYIKDLSKSIFWGVSEFDENRRSSRIMEWLPQLPSAESEAVVLRELTGGILYLNEKINEKNPEKCFSGQEAQIIHFATHAVKDEKNGSQALIMGKDDTGSYKILREEEIARMDWKQVKLAVFSGCNTGEEIWEESGKHSLRMAAKRAGASFSLSANIEVSDGISFFFMMCFYKNLLKCGKICEAFCETQRKIHTMTKKEILADQDYVAIGMEEGLKDFEEDSRPFGQTIDWGFYILQMN